MEKRMQEVMEARSHGINEALQRKGADFRVIYTSNLKNNVIFDGYALVAEGSSVNPVVYYSEKWWCGSDEEIANYLIKTKQAILARESDTKAIIKASMQPDYITAHVLPRLYGEENQNCMQAEDRYFVEFLDMLVGFYVPLMDLSSKDSMASMPITISMINELKLDADGLLNAAIENISKQSRVRNMITMLHEEAGFPIPPDELDNPSVPMLIVSNGNGINGAASILSKDVQEQIAGILGTEYIILPSSIHECICCPVKDTDELLAMVKDINAKYVSEEERLTNSVYGYRNGRIEKIA